MFVAGCCVDDDVCLAGLVFDEGSAVEVACDEGEGFWGVADEVGYGPSWVRIWRVSPPRKPVAPVRKILGILISPFLILDHYLSWHIGVRSYTHRSRLLQFGRNAT